MPQTQGQASMCRQSVVFVSGSTPGAPVLAGGHASFVLYPSILFDVNYRLFVPPFPPNPQFKARFPSVAVFGDGASEEVTFRGRLNEVIRVSPDFIGFMSL